MAIIDRIKFDGLRKEWLVYRYPGEAFVTGSQLIVGEGQVAVFVIGGQALDYFTAGTYTLSTYNIPLIQSFINIPFGGKTPFTAEIYFINKTAKLDIYWGTADPIQLIDPKYNIKLRVRAFGQFGMKVEDYRVFLTELIGSLNPLEVVSYEKMVDYFKGLLVMKVKTLIAKDIIKNKISALEISASIDDISQFCMDEVKEEFSRFGLNVVNFFIKSINFPDEDFAVVNKILQDKAAFDIIGDQRYITKRSFDTIEAAAGSENGVAGAFVGAGLGLGIGAGAANTLTGTGSLLNTGIPIVSLNRCTCGKEYAEGTAFCSQCGKRLLPEKIKCDSCGVLSDAGSKFCTNCGNSLIKMAICPDCKTENEPGAKFCKSCGKRMGV
jgi:membrane protease subunit (stomatin/prohibitin family)